MTTSKSPKRVLVEALKVAEASLPAYSHRFSPKKFTLHQLFACLVLKDFYGLTYRGAMGLLADGDSLSAAIGLKKIPHWTTLQEGGRSFAVVQLVPTASVHDRRANQKKAKIVRRRVRLAAVDTSGFEAQHTSRYYAQRRKMTAKDGKSTACRIVVTRSWAWLATRRATSSWRSRESGTAAGLRRLHTAGGGGEDPRGIENDSSGRWLRQRSESRVGPRRIGHPVVDPRRRGRPACRRDEPAGRYRKQMKRHLGQSRYGQRWQIETVNSMIKRLTGEVVNARTYWRRCRLLLLKTLTHNISILRRLIGFLLSSHDLC